ncbi:hypothetical protein FVEN_g9417 [Fusarium venenatum]|uniref:concanavalin A-like lectin/glucanase domain-containing protein n=1 Tax=Fusarium venenatum TaxID=56646 RepID=UPI001D5123BC|nr:hypothetical protein FVEN_g9417 [Fusarium venenatum]KAH6992958.1 concanavalin A-like lectin/glucanase domain-containing protein [Fusarium venenatum]
MVSMWSRIMLAASLAASVTAQTYSSCNPMKQSCDANPGLASSSYSVDFTKGSDDDNWEGTGHGDVKYTSEGAEFTINKQGQSPTIQTKWYMFFGRVEIHMKAAPGQGIVSSIVLLSDILDEVDWEFLGGRDAETQTNFYAKGSTDNTQSLTFPVENTQSEFHNYTVHWTQESCAWYINGVSVRTLNFAEARGGENYPQTPMRVKLGIWAGGDVDDNAEGTVEWAGGETDFSKIPFTMTVQKVKVENLNPAESYSYGDRSGSYKSIDFDKKDNGSNDKDDDEDEDETESTTASETASKTTSETAESATETTSDSDSDATTMSTAKASETGSSDFKNNKAAETGSSETDATSTGSSASATAESDENGASGNMPKMWLSLGALCAAMLTM